VEADMLSVTLIQKLFDSQDHSRMIASLVDNGTALPLALQSRLSHPVGASGMALRRLVELAYGPTPLSMAMTRDLLEKQHPNGVFPGTCERDPLITAAAAAGLAAVLREHTGKTGLSTPSPQQPHLADALDRALASLSAMQSEDGLFSHADDRTEQDRALTSVFVLFLLARLPGFREAVRFADLMTWFDERADQLDPDTQQLYHMASLDDPARQPPCPAMGALAA
jgi:hypothetical protein